MLTSNYFFNYFIRELILIVHKIYVINAMLLAQFAQDLILIIAKVVKVITI